ncbi:endonuclease [Shewanella sp. D64]|uniref:endonuclease n=1 Tax=unclassified Shewanella TaxID=196818 RepID=UPI0022BA23EE|nr:MULTISPECIES: endonuclease [unclassified Shewanella]MEC4724501.1 endonuclease [Shewanella sp. D64]MEC4736722.1 endonuclease [Shewanella sp. E94]WBJ94609.1 endonuclease [Shewanella sp. MTB7]
MKTNPTKVAMAMAMLCGTLSTYANADLVITEYIEGSSNNKAIEISNLGTETVNLDANEYVLTLYSNGKGFDDPGNTAVLTGMLAPNASVLIHNASADPEFILTGSIESNVTWYNGDDALVLTKDNVILDRFGKVGEQPDPAWTDPSNPDFSTMNKTLRRKASVTTGDTGAESSFPGDDNQWLVFEMNTSDGLGCPGEGACDGTTPPPEPEPDPAPCNNCDIIDKVADASTYLPDEYYSDVLNGDFADVAAKKQALTTIAATGHTSVSYKQVWSILTYSDEDPENKDNVIMLYSGKSISKHDNGGNTDDWNREHVWPQSHGVEGGYGNTDAHHLRPAMPQVNGARSNYDFDNGGTPVSQAPDNLVDTKLGTFEPRDAVKGDVARMMFYMDTRYEGGHSSNNGDLKLVDSIGTDGEKLEAGKLCTLYAWHKQDPVDTLEQNRNTAVYEYQGNRNPYIDRPEWVQDIYGALCNDAPVPDLDVDFVIDAPTEVNEGASFTFDATGTKGAEGQVLTFIWTQVSGPELAFDTDGAVLTAVAPIVAVDTPYQFKLTVSDGEFEAYEVVDLLVKDAPLAIEINILGETSVEEGEPITLEASADPANEAISFSWVQIAGETVEFEGEGAILKLTAPEVLLDSSLIFVVTATDGINSVSKNVTVTVKNVQGDGWTELDGAGSLGGLLGLLLPLAMWRRRKS